jgi:hypothetical protein
MSFLFQPYRTRTTILKVNDLQVKRESFFGIWLNCCQKRTVIFWSTYQETYQVSNNYCCQFEQTSAKISRVKLSSYMPLPKTKKSKAKSTMRRPLFILRLEKWTLIFIKVIYLKFLKLIFSFAFTVNKN